MKARLFAVLFSLMSAGRVAGAQPAPDEPADEMTEAGTGAEPVREADVEVEAPPGSGIGLALGLRAQVGVAQAFSDLGVAPAVEVEVGYRLPFLGRRFGVFVAAGYQYTYASGSGADDRLAAEGGTPYPGGYSWDLDEHAMTVTFGVLGRLFPDTDVFSPYLWVGPRVFLLESVMNGGAGGAEFGENTETSTEIGVGAGVGIEYLLGPGPLFAEIEMGWSPLPHAVTGDSSTGQIGLALGYRLFL